MKPPLNLRAGLFFGGGGGGEVWVEFGVYCFWVK